jgi:hypothetical protein
MVWTFDTERDQWHAAVPAETCIQSNFYTLTDVDGAHDDRLEDWLSSVEDKAVTPYERLLRGERLEGEARANFSHFAAVLHVRTPAMVRNAAMVHGHGAAMISHVLTKDRERFEKIMRRHNENASSDEVERAWNFARNPENYIIEVDQHAGLGQLSASDKLTEIFYDMGWAVEEPDRPLISCDNPIGRVSPPDSHHPFRGDGGFKNRRVSVSFPLSPNRCLTMHWSKDAPGVFKVDRERSMQLNRQRAYFSERQIFSSRQDPGIRNLGLKYCDHRPTMRIEGPKGLPKVEVKRKLRP